MNVNTKGSERKRRYKSIKQRMKILKEERERDGCVLFTKSCGLCTTYCAVFCSTVGDPFLFFYPFILIFFKTRAVHK